MPVYLYDKNEKIIKKGKGKWKYNFQQNGKRFKGVIYGAKNEKEAIEYERQMRSAVRNGTYKKPSQDITFTDFAINNYLNWIKLHRRSYRWYALLVNAFCQHFKNKPLGEITTNDVENYLMKRRGEETLRGIKRSGASVNRERAILSGIFTRAIKRGFFTGQNPCKDIERYDETRRERVFNRKEEMLLLNAFSGHNEVFRHITEIALGTGMRLGEIIKLRWEQVDFNRGRNGYIHVLASNAKSKKSRFIPMQPMVRSLMLRLKGTRIDGRIFDLSEKNAGQRINRMIKKIGLRDARFHDTRHTFATRCLDAGVHPFVVKEWLGHSTLVQTGNYCHVGFEENEQAIHRLERHNGLILQ